MNLFRIILQVPDLDQAAEFYAKLLDDPGRRIPHASRHYFDCGPVILALVDPSPDNMEAKPLPDFIYFSVNNLEQVHLRATALNCLAEANVHGAASGDIVVRPWGERSFYVNDPWVMDFASLMNKPYLQGDDIIPTLPRGHNLTLNEFP